MNNIFSFEKLAVWQCSRELVKSVYLLLEKFPSNEKFALSDQIRRCVISIPANIAEGSGRISLKEKIHFIEISYGSLMELYSHLTIANDLGYISAEDFSSLKTPMFEISKMLIALRKSFQEKL